MTEDFWLIVAPSRSGHRNPTRPSELGSQKSACLEVGAIAQQPRRAPGGGAQWTVTANEFPVSTTLSAAVLDVEPGAMHGLHWHPHSDEWQYYLEGAAEMAVYFGRVHTVTEQFETGDIGYVQMGAGHYIRNTGSGILRLLLGFNNGHYHAHDLNTWLASNPPDVLATNLDLPRTVAEALPEETLFIARPQRSPDEGSGHIGAALMPADLR